MYFQTPSTPVPAWKIENVDFNNSENVNPSQNHNLTQNSVSKSTEVTTEATTEVPRQEKSSHGMYTCLRPLLIVGNFIGFTPVDGLLQGNTELLSFRRKSIKGFLSALALLSLLFNTLIGIICLLQMDSKKLPEIVWASNPIIFFFVGFFGYTYMFLYMDYLLGIIKKWQRMKLSFKCDDQHLGRDANLIFTIIFSSAVLENLLQQTIQMSLFDFTRIRGGTDSNLNITKASLSSLEYYYRRTKQPQYDLLFAYHPALSILLFIWNKLALYSWNLLDILIILICRAVYFKFKAIARFVQKKIAMDNDKEDCIARQIGIESSSWEEISTDFETLYGMLEEIKKFLSPVVFTSYMVNLFFFILHLHMGLTPVANKGAAADVYRTWSFVHITGRIYLITLFAARINEFAEEFVDIIRMCPNDCYSKKVERIERFIKTTKPGIGGLNCFVVTKPFMLSLVSVVLTFEIVLLQTSGFSYF